ncbi:MAG TPA: hypothetical protein VK031_06495 [Tissierellaceae bacterium]|nr:hypothetical protein [Tissierellaceae bacterium]
MGKKLFYGIIIFSIIFSLTACLNPIEPGEPIISEHTDKLEFLSETEENQLMEEYGRLLKTDRNKDEIIGFIEENIEKLTTKNASQMILSLGEYLEDNNYPVYESYILLNKYKKYVSLEAKSYINIFFSEASNPYKSGDKVRINLEELTNRAIIAEDHLDIFSTGNTRDKIYNLYKSYVRGLIDHEENPYIKLEENNYRLAKETIDTYGELIEKNKGYRTTNLLSDFIKILEENNYNIKSQEIKDFYQDLDLLLEEEFN